MRSWKPDWPLQGSRIVLRPFVEADIRVDYVRWLNDPEVVRFSNQRFVRHTEETGRRYLQSFADTANLFVAIDDKVTNGMIGTLTVYRSLAHQTADIGIVIGDSSAWGKGYGQEAFALMVDVLLASGEVRKVTAGTMAPNVGMIKVMERSGLKWEATRHRQELLDGSPADLVYYARFK